MNAIRTSEAAIRHQRRIAACKARIVNAQQAQNAAARRADWQDSRMWLAHVAELQNELQTLRTMPIHAAVV